MPSSLLETYNTKRDFRRTNEPQGVVAPSGGNRFVVQKHEATRLHYDLRLELNGVLLSWAVTRGPSLDPAEKRLAVRTEDHPVSYAEYEGTIPQGSYGAGTVMLWDRGSWEPDGDPHEGLKAGKLQFRLHGERMQGAWMLIRMRGGKRENWLLRKVADDQAGDADSLTEGHTDSVKSGRSMAAIAGRDSTSKKRSPSRPVVQSEQGTRSSRKQAASPFQPLQLATLVAEAPAGQAWLHEIKYDGYRCLLVKEGTRVTAYTRYGNDWSDRFQALVTEAQTIPAERALLDGEVVVLNAKGRSDFARLQNAMREDAPLDFFAFDLLAVGDEDLRALPLSKRKARLDQLLKGLPVGSSLHVSPYQVGGGPGALETACRGGLEGIVSKRADAPYVGGRSEAWLKVKCLARQEFVIIGWTPSNKRAGFASLLLGLRHGDQLRYAGRVGTGFTRESIADVAERLRALEISPSPVPDLPARLAGSARWVEPTLVAEVTFTEFTRDGIARHPSFVGLRDDKPADAVTVEQAKPLGRAPKEALSSGAAISSHGIRISSPEREQYPEAHVTKRDLVTFYERVAGMMLPHIRDRPLTLIRCPRGVGERCFIQQHAAAGFPEAVRRVAITETSGAVEEHFFIEDLAGILACVQMGAVEFHGWGSRASALESPDRLVFDLDPDPMVPFRSVVEAAHNIRDRLRDDGISAWPLLSGGKGIHVVVPLIDADWASVHGYARRFAEKLQKDAPEQFTSDMAKADRQGRIFVDYLRNERGLTAVMPFSTRAKPSASVAMPVDWEQLGGIKSAQDYTVRRALAEGVPGVDGWLQTPQRLPRQGGGKREGSDGGR
ncbi:DNA ligase D [Methylobacterium isbiliense]|uniref:DNA ligase (ATP) n=1 Tax=Methylobacterium isbiliense TaxID=315478 RepID=A0ABQ4S6F0_9HYPH|nr:DNA ligase D [Methylobacterium isbiliense]MDN3625771.1 DNA ligase D [Methylobacterium isbiliense]GJD98751.1 Multifunctional non-homologous end joining protein LigD [Methylobacterium isbiliense]